MHPNNDVVEDDLEESLRAYWEGVILQRSDSEPDVEPYASTPPPRRSNRRMALVMGIAAACIAVVGFAFSASDQTPDADGSLAPASEGAPSMSSTEGLVAPSDVANSSILLPAPEETPNTFPQAQGPVSDPDLAGFHEQWATGWFPYGDNVDGIHGYVRAPNPENPDPLALSEAYPVYDAPDGAMIGYAHSDLGFVDLVTVYPGVFDPVTERIQRFGCDQFAPDPVEAQQCSETLSAGGSSPDGQAGG